MENASKALIIAGAILLAIVLVSLGVLVINNSRKDINDKNLDEASIEAFNKNISQYCGKNKSATTMNSLVSAISASNGAQLNKAVKHYIVLDCTGATDKLGSQTVNPVDSSSGKYYPTLNSSKMYDASFETTDDGYISKVFIKDHT